jgi:hypothetical protein
LTASGRNVVSTGGAPCQNSRHTCN